tara:strand:+ start:4607 stop:6883 length:2277 start_codon:yes stop_codon:yes gene_type:complete
MIMNKDFTVVTSFAVRDWETYGKRFVESFIEFWPETIKLLCYCDGFPMPEDAPQVDNIEYIDLLDNQDLIDFKERNKQFNGTLPQKPYNFYEDAIKFCHKVYAQNMAANKAKTEWLLWLDADSVTYEPVGVQLLKKVCDSEYDIVYLGRKDAYATCSSFIGFNLSSSVTPVFMDDYVNYYNSDEVLKLKCFADNFVFDRVRIIHEAHGMRSLDLTPDCTILEAFDLCELSKAIIHLKGNRKRTSREVRVTAARYHDLFNTVQHYKRKNILEVGTWNGDTACGMIMAAFQNSDEVHYTGIDLFEDADEVSDKKEFNVKAHYSKKAVSLKLQALAKEYELEDKKLTFHLIKGDSKEKLKILKDKSMCGMYNIFPDFVFIDGGHSIETVKSDFNHCKNIPVIVMDDYYTEDESGGIPEPEYRGVNDIYNDVLGGTKRTGKKQRIIIPSSDRVKGGGNVSLALIVNDPKLPKLPDVNRVPVQVNPRDCVPSDNIQFNVKENLKLFNKRMVETCHWHDGKTVIVSGGPSFKKKKNLNKIKKLQDSGAKVVCVKHSHNPLIENGIIPWGCVILDPRPFDGVSTHGHVRKDLLEEPHPETNYIIASMTNPEVTKHIKTNKGKLLGWHAFTNSLTDMKELEGVQMITGGTCSAMRSVGVMHVLGFREFHIFGMDCCYEGTPKDIEEKDLYGKKKWLKVGILNEKTNKETTFYTTGELLALAQDFESLLERDQEVDMDLYVYGDGMVPTIFKTSDYKIKQSFDKKYT